MAKLIAPLAPHSRMIGGENYFQGLDGEMHHASEFHVCGECKHFSSPDAENRRSKCAHAVRVLLGKFTIACPKFEPLES